MIEIEAGTMKIMFSLNKFHRTITGENNGRISIGKKTCDVSVGESVKIIRELQGLSQNELVALTGIPQSTLSAIEHDQSTWELIAPKNWQKPSNAILRYWFFPGGILKPLHNTPVQRVVLGFLRQPNLPC